MREFFASLISSSPDSQSAGRFAFLFQVIVSNTVVWYVWLIACLWTRSIVNMPSGVVEIYGAANGVAFLGKGMQSWAERPKYQTQSKPVIIDKDRQED